MGKLFNLVGQQFPYFKVGVRISAFPTHKTVVKIKFCQHRQCFENQNVLFKYKILFIINNSECWHLLGPGLNLMEWHLSSKINSIISSLIILSETPDKKMYWILEEVILNCGFLDYLGLRIRTQIVTQTSSMSFSPCLCPTPVPNRFAFNFALSGKPWKVQGGICLRFFTRKQSTKVRLYVNWN